MTFRGLINGRAMFWALIFFTVIFWYLFHISLLIAMSSFISSGVIIPLRSYACALSLTRTVDNWKQLTIFLRSHKILWTTDTGKTLEITPLMCGMRDPKIVADTEPRETELDSDPAPVSPGWSQTLDLMSNAGLCCLSATPGSTERPTSQQPGAITAREEQDF